MSLLRKLLNLPNHIKKAIVLFVVLIVIGTTFYSAVEGWKILTALYFSVITLTTIGYGELHPTHAISQFFTMLFVLIGVGTILYIFSSITHYLNQTDERYDIEKLEELIEKMEKLRKEMPKTK